VLTCFAGAAAAAGGGGGGAAAAGGGGGAAGAGAAFLAGGAASPPPSFSLFNSARRLLRGESCSAPVFLSLPARPGAWQVSISAEAHAGASAIPPRLSPKKGCERSPGSSALPTLLSSTSWFWIPSFSARFLAAAAMAFILPGSRCSADHVTALLRTPGERWAQTPNLMFLRADHHTTTRLLASSDLILLLLLLLSSHLRQEIPGI